MLQPAEYQEASQQHLHQPDLQFIAVALHSEVDVDVLCTDVTGRLLSL